jgi:hypothetical protein
VGITIEVAERILGVPTAADSSYAGQYQAPQVAPRERHDREQVIMTDPARRRTPDGAARLASSSTSSSGDGRS